MNHHDDDLSDEQLTHFWDEAVADQIAEYRTAAADRSLPWPIRAWSWLVARRMLKNAARPPAYRMLRRELRKREDDDA